MLLNLEELPIHFFQAVVSLLVTIRSLRLNYLSLSTLDFDRMTGRAENLRGLGILQILLKAGPSLGRVAKDWPIRGRTGRFVAVPPKNHATHLCALALWL